MGLTVAGATALDAGLNFIGGMFANSSNAQYNAEEAQKNREFQERMYNKQVEDSIRFWNMQNEYNNPSAAYAREIKGLSENGLNPALMYGQGGLSGNLAAQAPDLPSAPHGAQAQTHFNNPIEMANLALLEAQTNLLNKQAEKTGAETENIGEQTTGLQFMNWLNDQTKNIQVAIRFRDYDRVNQLIEESRQKVWNMREDNYRAWSQLAIQNNIAIRQMNLNEYQVGQNVVQGWESLRIGRLNANAALRSASAAWLNAKSNWNLSNAQVGVLRETATKMQLDNDFMRRTMDSRVYQFHQGDRKAYWDSMNSMMNNLLLESNIRNIDSNTWLNSYKTDLMESQTNYLNIQTFLAPLNSLSSFGAPASAGAGANGYTITPTW